VPPYELRAIDVRGVLFTNYNAHSSLPQQNDGNLVHDP